MTKIILFDGACTVCHKSVQFIIKRDLHGTFRFASLQSEIGQNLLKQYHVPTDIDSIVCIANERVYVKSSAVLRIARDLHGVWKLAALFFIVPKPIRDFFYDLFAKNRHKLFRSKNNTCQLPSRDDRKRFL